MKNIPLIRPLIAEEEVNEVRRVLESGWITQGPETALFEQEFAAFVDAPFACAVSSCTSALHIALKTLDVGHGDEVLSVSHSFVATNNAIRQVNAHPVFIDVDQKTGNINPNLMAQAITSKTKAIIAVHQLGMPCDMFQVMAIAKQFEIPVIEDAACAIGSELLVDKVWQKIGKPHGTICCFSFHPRKLLTTGDGGMLTTADASLDRKFRLLRQHGMSVSDSQRHGSNKVVFEEYLTVGYNYRMTDLQAAIGRVQLKKIPAILEQRRQLADNYRRLFAGHPQIGFFEEPSWAKTNWQTLVVKLPQGTNQKSVMQLMLNAGIATRRGVMCAHREQAYAEKMWRCSSRSYRCGCQGYDCPNLAISEHLQNNTIAIPLFHDITYEQQCNVVNVLLESLC